MSQWKQEGGHSRIVINNQAQQSQQYFEGESPSSWSHYQQLRQQRQNGISSKNVESQDLQEINTASDGVRLALQSIYGDPSVCSSNHSFHSSRSGNSHHTGNDHGHRQENDGENGGNKGIDDSKVEFGINGHISRVHNNKHQINNTADNVLFDGNDSSIAFSLSDIEDNTDDSSYDSTKYHNRDINKEVEDKQTLPLNQSNETHDLQQYMGKPLHLHDISHGKRRLTVHDTDIKNSASLEQRDNNKHTDDNPYELPTTGDETTNRNKMAVATITPASLIYREAFTNDSLVRSGGGIGVNVGSIVESDVNDMMPPTVHRYNQNGEGYLCDKKQRDGISSTNLSTEDDHYHLSHHHNQQKQQKEQQNQQKQMEQDFYQQEQRSYHRNQPNQLKRQQQVKHHQHHHQQQQLQQQPFQQYQNQQIEQREKERVQKKDQQEQQRHHYDPKESLPSYDLREENFEPPITNQIQNYDKTHLIPQCDQTPNVQDNNSKPKVPQEQQTKSSSLAPPSRSVSCDTYIDNIVRTEHKGGSTRTLNNNKSIQYEQQEIYDLKEQIQLIRKERDNLREDMVRARDLNSNKAQNTALTHQTEILERKYQVELDSMRQVANQVQEESDEKVSRVEGMLEQMKKKLEVMAENHRLQIMEKDNILREKEHQLQKRHKGDKEDKKNNIFWRDSFKVLVEQLSLYYESGVLQWNTNLPSTTPPVELLMSEVVLAAVTGEKAREVVKKEMESLLHILSKPRSLPTARKRSDQNFTDSCVQTDVDALPIPSLGNGEGIECLDPNKKDMVQSTSVGIDTADLRHFAQPHHLNNNYPNNETNDPNSDRYYNSNLPSHQQYQHSLISSKDDNKRTTELQLENASLRGTNEHLTDQLQRCQKQLQLLNESCGVTVGGVPFNSPSSTTTTAVPTKTKTEEEVYLSTLVNQLQRSNAQYTQSNEILEEKIQILEEENRKGAQRCVDLERLAEEATAECERFIRNIDHLEQDRGKLTVDNSGLAAKLETLTNRHSEELERTHMEKVRVEEDFIARIATLERDRCEILESKKELDSELKSLISKNSQLVSDANKIEKEHKDQSLELKELQERSKTWELDQNLHDKYTNLVKKIQKVEQESSSLLKSKMDLEDECARLRNFNLLTKAKMEQQETDLRSLKKAHEISKREGSELELRLESIRTENIILADGNTDLEMDLSRMKKECEDLQKLLKSDGTEKKRLGEEVARLKNECSIVASHKENAERTSKEVQDRCSSLTATVETGRIELASMKKRIDDSIEEKKKREKSLALLHEEVEELKKLKKDKEDENFHLQQEIKKLQESNDRLNQKIDEMEYKHTVLKEKISSFDLKESDWVKNKTTMKPKHEVLMQECTSVRDSNEAADRIVKGKIQSLSPKCTSLQDTKSMKDTNERLRSDISNHNEVTCCMSETNKTIPQLSRLSTPLTPHHTTDHKVELTTKPVQAPATIDNGITVPIEGHRLDHAHTSIKGAFTDLSSCLFENKSDTSQAVKLDRSMDERLQRLKLATQKASRTQSMCSKHTSSNSSVLRIQNETVTPLIVKPAIKLNTTNDDQKKNSNSSSMSLEETEMFIMNILNSCEKKKNLNT